MSDTLRIVTDFVAIGAGVSGFVTAVFALRAANSANKIAAAGNELAKDANDTAADALALTEAANSIAKRPLVVAQDDIPFNWTLSVDDYGIAHVTNDCDHRATQVSITVDCDAEVVAQEGLLEVVEPFGLVQFDLTEAIAKYFKRVQQNPFRPSQSGGGIFIAGSEGKAVSTTFRAHLRWRTGEGVLRTDIATEIVRRSMTSNGPRRTQTHVPVVEAEQPQLASSFSSIGKTQRQGDVRNEDMGVIVSSAGIKCSPSIRKHRGPERSKRDRKPAAGNNSSANSDDRTCTTSPACSPAI